MMTLSTPPARRRDVDEALADPGRVARSRADHAEGLRRLATAAGVAVGRGATRDEILAAVVQAIDGLASTSTQAANARARVHDGNDQF